MLRIDSTDKMKQQFFLICLILLLMVSVARTNYGIWNADIPLGDEASYIDQAFRLYEKGELSRNLYFDAYIMFFRYVSTDPITAHYCIRFISSLFSVITLFLLLSSLKWVSFIGAFVMALLWNLNLLNTPLIQFGNVNLFVFTLVCFAGYLWLVDAKKYTRPFSIIILLVAIMVRHEYALLLFLLAMQKTALWLTQYEEKGMSKKRLIQLSSVAVAILIPVAVIALSPNLRSYSIKLISYLDTYLFLGLKQCYTAFSVTRNSALHLEPYTEFDVLMARKFPGASGFFSAVLINPFEVLKYFFLNGISNLTHLYYMLPNHSILLPSGLVTNGLTNGLTTGDFVSKKFAGYPVLWFDQIVNLLLIAFGALWFLLSKMPGLNPRRIWTYDDFVFVIGMAAVSITPMLLHIPDPRYWIMVLPLLFWGPAALISKYCVMRSYRTMFGLSVLLSFVFVNPVFTSTLNSSLNKNKDVALALRNRLSLSPGAKTVKALGFYPGPILSFSIPGRWESTNNMEVRKGSSFEELVKSKGYDLVIIDGFLRKTEQYNKEKAFFDKLLQHPEMYDYDILLNTAKRDGPIYILKKKGPS